MTTRRPKPRDRRLRLQREVYFIQGQALRLIKIGFGEAAETRLRMMQACSPDRLTIIGRILTDDAQAMEGELHRRSLHLCVHGEWHRPGDDLLAYIAAHGQSYRADTEAELRRALEALPVSADRAKAAGLSPSPVLAGGS